jgi:hypothetical protein
LRLKISARTEVLGRRFALHDRDEGLAPWGRRVRENDLDLG